MYYPLYLDLASARCLIVGAGEVGLRKARTLLEAQPQELLVLDVAPFGVAWQPLQEAYPCLRLEIRPYTAADLDNRALVFACTGNRVVNTALAAECARQRVFCNCADAPLEGTCLVPATARMGPLVAALSTGGGSPAWARMLRQELEAWLVPRAPMTQLLARLRPHVLALGEDTGRNTALFRTLARSPLRQALAEGDATRCQELLRSTLPDAMHPLIPELLYDLL